MSYDLESPQSRNERILHNILGANYDLEPPQSREEKLLYRLLGQLEEMTSQMVPTTEGLTGDKYTLKTVLENGEAQTKWVEDPEELPAPYDSTVVYHAGDIIMYEGEAYQCISDTTIGEDFDITKWQSTQIAANISENTKNILTTLKRLGNVTFHFKGAAAGTTTNLTIPPSSQHVIFFTSALSSLCGMCIVTRGKSTDVAYTPINIGTSLSVAVNGGTFSVTNNHSNTGVRINIMRTMGGAIE